jgi:hypothetical protein
MGGHFIESNIVEGIGDELLYAIIILLGFLVPLVIYLYRLR